MTEILIRVDAAKRSLTVASSANNAVEPMSSRVSWVFAFLGLLVEAARRGVVLDEPMLQRALAALGQSPALNRATLSRLVREAERLLDVARSTGIDAGQLSFGPRAMTTGPWRWVMSADMLSRVEVVWQLGFDVPVIFSAASDLPAPLSIASSDAPGATLACVRAALAADRKMLAGDYGVAAEGFVGLLARTDLSAEFRHVMLLRQQRAERRAGEFGAARETLASLLQMVNAQPKLTKQSKQVRPTQRVKVDDSVDAVSLPAPNASWLCWVADACRVAGLRLDYDTAPRLNFGVISSQLASFSPVSSPIGEWAAEAHSLRSLTLRRRAVAAANAGETVAAKALAAEAWQHNSSALLMAYAARDHDNVQNFLVNAGILFSELHDHKIDVAYASGASGSALTALTLAMRFYELSLECADHFMCGEDTAWEHVALGGLWLSNPGERAALQVNAGMALRSDRLGSAAFFVAGVARAERCGTPRQQVGAITNLWLFAHEGEDAALTRRARKLLIEMISGGHALRALYDGPEHSPLLALFGELELPTTKRRKSGRKTGW